MFFLSDIEKFKFFDDVYLLAVCICLGLEKKKGEKKKGNREFVISFNIQKNFILGVRGDFRGKGI